MSNSLDSPESMAGFERSQHPRGGGVRRVPPGDRFERLNMRVRRAMACRWRRCRYFLGKAAPPTAGGVVMSRAPHRQAGASFAPINLSRRAGRTGSRMLRTIRPARWRAAVSAATSSSPDTNSWAAPNSGGRSPPARMSPIAKCITTTSSPRATSADCERRRSSRRADRRGGGGHLRRLQRHGAQQRDRGHVAAILFKRMGDYSANFLYLDGHVDYHEFHSVGNTSRPCIGRSPRPGDRQDSERVGCPGCLGPKVQASSTGARDI
jgi:prepilin-type processing-associated H-X9-DG protein